MTKNETSIQALYYKALYLNSFCKTLTTELLFFVTTKNEVLFQKMPTSTWRKTPRMLAKTVRMRNQAPNNSQRAQKAFVNQLIFFACLSSSWRSSFEKRSSAMACLGAVSLFLCTQVGASLPLFAWIWSRLLRDLRFFSGVIKP